MVMSGSSPAAGGSAGTPPGFESAESLSSVAAAPGSVVAEPPDVSALETVADS
jgi:hypothetical protein